MVRFGVVTISQSYPASDRSRCLISSLDKEVGNGIRFGDGDGGVGFKSLVVMVGVGMSPCDDAGVTTVMTSWYGETVSVSAKVNLIRFAGLSIYIFSSR